MKNVNGYYLYISRMQQVWMPEGAEILSVGFEGEQLMVFALVDPSLQQVPVNFYVVSAGEPTDCDAVIFVGTACKWPELSWHVFVDPPQLVADPV